ncbi:MAG: hypothetical protein JW855_01145 [Gammaproteobacteria bacterium]|nr:hypothetical protein [Gammaproteobacteria bacterium]
MLDNNHPDNHSFPTIIIYLTIMIKLSTSASFRSIGKIIALFNLYLDLNIKAPSHVSILTWVKKFGIYKLECVAHKADDWVIILDESVQFGHSKLLVVLGIRESMIDFTRPLQYEDMVCLKLKASQSWKSDEILDIIKSVENEVGTIKYAVADMGNSIKKAISLHNIQHVADITHIISLIFKEIFGKDPQFEEYITKLSKLRGEMPLTEISHLLPPKQRANSRFMNLKPIFNWGKEMVSALPFMNIPKKYKEKLETIYQYKDLILQTCELIDKANKIQKILKNNGLSMDSKRKCLRLFSKTDNPKTRQFKQKITDYFNDILNKFPKKTTILCTSDMIESSFGKFKFYTNKNTSIGITNLALTIPAFLGKTEITDVHKGLSMIKVDNLKSWSAEYIGDTELKKRRNAMNMG